MKNKPDWSSDDAVLYETVSGFYPEASVGVEEASFSECIRMADCIVGVNVATGGYYEILQKGAPLIHFQNADVISQQPDLPPEAILQVTQFEALRTAVESVLFDENLPRHCLRSSIVLRRAILNRSFRGWAMRSRRS